MTVSLGNEENLLNRNEIPDELHHYYGGRWYVVRVGMMAAPISGMLGITTPSRQIHQIPSDGFMAVRTLTPMASGGS
jgi:hypothetical protein